MRGFMLGAVLMVMLIATIIASYWITVEAHNFLHETHPPPEVK